MNIQITSQKREVLTSGSICHSFVFVTDGSTIAVTYMTGSDGWTMINTLVMNSSSTAWGRRKGQNFSTWNDAIAAYKTDRVKAAIATARDIVAAS
jgi:hypothetical protein